MVRRFAAGDQAAVTRPRIEVLPRAAAERIAAGEVVERPASVVKELIENSLDAGARRITIEIDGAGSRLIRVSDDGAGIPAEQLALAFERFATSKIRSAEDLRRVNTYGFRGEALPSIAAVARVTIVTRPAGADTAAALTVAGGARAAPAAAGAADGTTVTVENLFYNTPARRRFLKSPARETAVIVETVQALALAAPSVAFRLVDGDREIAWMPPESYEDRARRILGAALRDRTLPIDARGLTGITGVLGTPEAAQARRSHQWFLVNGRPVRSPMLARALDQAYHTLIPEGRVPAAVLHVRVPQDSVDVNIHPRKAEVRFADERLVFNDVVREVRRALHGAALVHTAPDAARWTGVLPARRDAGAGLIGAAAGVAESASGYGQGTAAELDAVLPALWTPQPPVAAWPSIRVLGQLALTYIVGEAGGDLVLVDQHAAHERVLYERLLARRRAGGARAQGLVTPAVMELSPAEAALLPELAGPLAALGFEVEAFGRATVRLRAVPAIAADRDAITLFRECLADLGAGRDEHAGRSLEERLAIATACHTAVRAGDRLDQTKMAALLEELARAEDPYSCFHGRPTMVRLRGRDLERWFYRKV
ncbi:MAG TPA: DNA mismatch repair endonuclease MutL [bacterium]|nr:DNA mismatch repair endonuclease MutL [bacterium]